MSVKNHLLEKAIKLSLWGEKEWRIGPISILACDLSLSFNIMTRSSNEERTAAWLEDREWDIPLEEYSYGISIEPFILSLINKDGDICWSSPNISLMNWLCVQYPEVKE